MAELFDEITHLHIQTYADDGTGTEEDPVVLDGVRLMRHAVRVRNLRFVPKRIQVHAEMIDRVAVFETAAGLATSWTKEYRFHGDKRKPDVETFGNTPILRHPDLSPRFREQTQITVHACIRSDYFTRELKSDEIFLDVNVQPVPED